MSLTAWPERVRRYLARELWEARAEDGERLWPIRLLQFGIMLGEGFVRDRLLLRASALSYFTVLSVVPLLAVAVSIASAVGIGSETFLDWVIGTVAGGAPEAEQTIRRLVRGADFTGLGTVGGGVLLVTTVLAIGNVEGTLNDIWGVTGGRGWVRRFSDYLAVLIVAPLLGGLALSLASSLRSHWAQSWLAEMPVFGPLHGVGASSVPMAMLAVAFTFLYWFLPNTRVRPVSALIGGLVSGVLVVMAQSLYIDFSVGMASANTFFGGFALAPLLFIWIYVFWALVLLGAEIAFAHQNFDLYREEVRGRAAGPAEREAIALCIALEVASSFRRGGPAPDAAILAEELQVPVRTVRSVAAVLVEAGLLSTRAEAEQREALQLGRPADTIPVSEVLLALRGARDLPPEQGLPPRAARILDALEGAMADAAGRRTLAELLADDDLATPAPGG